MKKVLVLLLVLLVATSVVFAQGSKEAGAKKQLMGVVTPSADHGFTAESIRHSEAQVKALAAQYGFDYRFMTAADSSFIFL